ncbi:MAG TPA: hypothetical protein VFE84_02710, partial [Patescibacteria group bacterium]|nr:hypothetical protein [Patescibacteria group bacterium]
MSPGSVFYFRDVSQNHHPARQLTTAMISAGDAPLWNPLRGAGQPLLANPNMLVLHPTTLLFVVLPFEWAFKMSIVLQIVLAGAGAWLVLRDIGASRAGSLLGAAVFCLSGYMLSLGNLINLLDSAAFMPLTVWLAGRAMTRGFSPWGSLAALSLAVQIMAGEPSMLLCTAAGFLGLHWSLGGGATERSAPAGAPAGQSRSLVWRLAGAAGIVLLALAISMVAVLPTVELLAQSERGAGFDREEALKWSLPPMALLQTAVPDLFGDPTRTDIASYWGGGVFDAGLPFILSLYLGPAAIILACAGLAGGLTSGNRRRRAEALVLAALALGGITLSLGRFFPLYPALLSLLKPLESVRYPVKYFLIVVWAMS